MSTQKRPHNEDTTETIIRFSGTWWAYLFFRLGFLRALVNGVEDALAITGRFLLLVFLIYCGAEAGLLLADPNYNFPGWLQMTMFCLQLAGLEGSIPGLARQADALRAKDDEASAQKVEGVMLSARVMTVLSIGEGALYALHVPPTLLQILSALLLFVRGIVITGFLIALAKIESKAPRVLSKDAHAREQQQQAQRDEQTRTIADLRNQLDQVLANLNATQQQAQQGAHEQARIIKQLREQVQQMEAAQASLLTGTKSQDGIIRNVRDQLAHTEEQVANLQAQLSQVNQDKQHLTASLDQLEKRNAALLEEKAAARVKAQSEEACEKSCESERINLSHTVKMHEVKLRNITSFDQARVKHSAFTSVKTKTRDTEVLAYMAEHPGTRVPEVAAHFEITPRTIYNILKRRSGVQDSESDKVAQS